MYFYLTFIGLLSLLFIIIKLTFLARSKKLHLPPCGPLSLPLIGHLYLFKKPLHRTLAGLASKHGPILQLNFGSRPVLVVSSTSLAEECFSKNDIAFANRPQLPSERHLSYEYTNLGDTDYGVHWRNLRRIATVELLSTQRINTFTSMRAAEVHAMVHKLFQEWKENVGGSESEFRFKKVVLRPKLFLLTVNVMMKMITGNRSFDDSKESREFEEIVEESLSLSGGSNIGDFLPILRPFDMVKAERRLKKLQAWRDKFLQGLVDEYRNKDRRGQHDAGQNKEEKKKAMLGVLLSLQDSDPKYYTDRIIKSLMATSLVAGTDTSSNTMEWAMALLISNPEVLTKAREEMDRCVEKGRLVSEPDLQNLRYLRCILYETLRLYPVAPLLLPHESRDDCVLGGYDVPRGTILLVNAYTVHRDPSVWAEPEKFRPERFLGDGGEKHRLITFGMGRRRCPGEGLAMQEMSIALGALIQCFDWERNGDEEVDMGEGSGVTMPMVKPLEVLYRPRQEMMNALQQSQM